MFGRIFILWTALLYTHIAVLGARAAAAYAQPAQQQHAQRQDPDLLIYFFHRFISLISNGFPAMARHSGSIRGVPGMRSLRSGKRIS
jgi:hypothetical protein